MGQSETLASKKISPEKNQVNQRQKANLKPKNEQIVNKMLEKNPAIDHSSSLSNYLNFLNIFDDSESIQSKQFLTLGIIKVLKNGFCQAFLYDIIIYGSFLFQASKKSSDVDLMAISPEGIDRKKFFEGLVDYFNSLKFHLLLRRVLSEIYSAKFVDCNFSYTYISTARFPIMKLKFVIVLKDTPLDFVIRFDLAMVNLSGYPSDPKKLVDLEMIYLEQNFNDPANLIGVEGLFSSLVVRKLFESDLIYQNSLKFLKLWAERKNINDFQLGYFKGFHLTIMLLYVRLENPLITTEQDLLLKFAEFYKDRWHPTFVVPNNPQKLSNYVESSIYSPLIFYPVYHGRPMIDRMPFSVSQVILFEITNLFNFLNSFKGPMSFQVWEELLKESLPYDTFVLNSTNTIKMTIKVVDKYSKSEKFISFIHSQLFKFIQSLEDLNIGGSMNKNPFPQNPAERKNIIVVVKHLPASPVFDFKIFTPHDFQLCEFNEDNIIRLWNLFLDMIQSSFQRQFSNGANGNFIALGSIEDPLFEFTFSI
jgi:hypothetical protein